MRIKAVGHKGANKEESVIAIQIIYRLNIV